MTTVRQRSSPRLVVTCVPVVRTPHRRDVHTGPDAAPARPGEALDELDHLAHRHVAVRIRPVVAMAREVALPVRGEQPQRVPAFVPPGVRHLAALEHDMVDRPLAEEVAGGEAGVAGADDDRGDALDGLAVGSAQTTSTVTSVGFVRASKTAERFWDWATKRLDVLRRGVRVDVEGHLDVVEAVADVAVGTQDPADVVVALDGRLDRPQLDAAVLRHGRDAAGQAAGQADEEVLDRRDGVVRRREDLGVVGVEAPSRPCGSAPRRGRRSSGSSCVVWTPFCPLGGGLPGELGGLRCALQHLACVEQCLDVDSVVGRGGHVA